MLDAHTQSPPNLETCEKRKREEDNIIQPYTLYCYSLLFHDEMKERPQLLQGVLEGSPCDQQMIISPKLHQSPIEEGIVILEAMGFVHNEGGPCHTSQKVLVLEEDLVSGKDGVKLEFLVRV